MADAQIEFTGPDPAAFSLGNDETVNSRKVTSATDELNDRVIANGGHLPTDELKKGADGANHEDAVNTPKRDISVATTGHTLLEPADLDKKDNTADSLGDNDSKENSSRGQEKKSQFAGKGSRDQGRSSNRGDKLRNHNDRPRKNYSGNIKSDLISQEESSDPVAIRKQVRFSSRSFLYWPIMLISSQVEFYFSDSNLHQDKFLLSKVEGHKNYPVPISVIHSFKRMRHFQPLSAIIDALKESTVLDVVDNDSCIQRKIPLAEEMQDKPIYEVKKVYEDKAMSRSVYVKGFGEEQNSTQFDIEAFFTPYGPTNSVRLRRTLEKVFKSSVFVEFNSEETQQKFLALDPPPKFNGRDLIIKSKKQYCDEKVNDIAAGKVKPKSRQYDDGSKRSRDGGNDERDWRERRREDQKSGFNDRGGRGHKGLSSSGRGRGGRGNRDGGGRDKNDEKERQEKEQYGIHRLGYSYDSNDALVRYPRLV